MSQITELSGWLEKKQKTTRFSKYSVEGVKMMESFFLYHIFINSGGSESESASASACTRTLEEVFHAEEPSRVCQLSAPYGLPRLRVRRIRERASWTERARDREMEEDTD